MVYEVVYFPILSITDLKWILAFFFFLGFVFWDTPGSAAQGLLLAPGSGVAPVVFGGSYGARDLTQASLWLLSYLFGFEDAILVFFNCIYNLWHWVIFICL